MELPGGFASAAESSTCSGLFGNSRSMQASASFANLSAVP